MALSLAHRKRVLANRRYAFSFVIIHSETGITELQRLELLQTN